MDSELNNRFFQKKLQQLLTNSTKSFPTVICEVESPEVTELVRKFCLFSPMRSFTQKMIEIPISETLEKLRAGKVESYGEIYILINYN